MRAAGHAFERLAEPAFAQRLVEAARLPDVHRAEVRLRRVRIADALHDAQRMVLQQLGEALERADAGRVVVDLLQLRRRQLQRRPELGVVRILERHDGVEPVVAAGQFDDDEDGVLCPLLPGSAERPARSGRGKPGRSSPRPRGADS